MRLKAKNQSVNKHQRQKLEALLKSLPKGEQDRLYAEARKQRSDAQKRRNTKNRESIDGEQLGRSKQRPDPLINWVLRIVERDFAHKHENTPNNRKLAEARVVGLTRRRATVLPKECNGADLSRHLFCRLSAELAGRQQNGIAVGDRVMFAKLDIPADSVTHEIVSVLPRKSKLARPDSHDTHKERVVAANVDIVVIVVSVVSPPLHPRLIDRYLVAIEWGNCKPIIAVNKTDLLAPNELDETLKTLKPYQQAGIPIAICAAAPNDDSGTQVDELRQFLIGKTCAFVGHSGVGKSSLANALDQSLEIATRTVRQTDNRGRHTTTASTMHFIEPDIRIIDTPGIRFFGLAKISPEELRWLFPEFAPFVHTCKFTNCSHDHEPRCAVKAAVEAGKIAPERYDTYLRLLEELRTGGKPKDVSERIRSDIDRCQLNEKEQ